MLYGVFIKYSMIILYIVMLGLMFVDETGTCSNYFLWWNDNS